MIKPTLRLMYIGIYFAETSATATANLLPFATLGDATQIGSLLLAKASKEDDIAL
jgi:hypothetical protein